MRSFWTFLATLAVVLLLPTVGRASGRGMVVKALILDPHDARTVYARTTFGLLATRDGGASWRWICERAVGTSETDDPTYVVTPKGTIVGATLAGIVVSRDGGCSFSFAGGRDAHPLTHLTMRPDGAIFGVAASKEGQPRLQRLVVSQDDAQTFAVAAGPSDPTLQIERVEIAPSDRVRLYLTGARGGGDDRTAAFFVSYDAAMSWVERKLDVAVPETARVVATVDPANADRLFVRTEGLGRDKVFVTTDAGKTWKRIFDSDVPLYALVLSEDGKRVFVSANDGVSTSPTDVFAFAKASSLYTTCLTMTGNLLWACGGMKDSFAIGTSRNGAKSFDVKLKVDLQDVQGPIECPAESAVAKECPAQWPDVRRKLGLPETDEKPRNVDPGGPALRGRATRTGRSRTGFGAMAGIALVGLAGYYVLKRLRRR